MEHTLYKLIIQYSKAECILYVIKIERYIHHIAFDISGLFIQTRFKGYSRRLVYMDEN